MMDWINDNLWLAWIGVAVVLAVVELLSLDLVLLMFALSALVAAAVGTFAPLWVTLIVFGVVAILLLTLIRPKIVAKLHSGPTLPVGHQSLIGRPAIVDEPVSDLAGRVVIDGEYWTARTASGEHHDVGTQLVVVSIDGATAYVAGKVTA